MAKNLFGGLGDLGKLVNGLAGNLNQMDNGAAKTEYGKYLLEGEEIVYAFVLIRDAIIFTNIRLIIVDKQGATGKKTAIKSIFLMNIVDCEMETAGMGLDDSEITISYLTNVKRNAHSQAVAVYKIEFPKSLAIEPLYKWLMSLAYKNRLEINEME